MGRVWCVVLSLTLCGALVEDGVPTRTEATTAAAAIVQIL